MRIGIPSETKTLEGRVALVPAACADLVRRGHEVFIQSGAGTKSGFSDDDFVRNGVKVLADADALYATGELIVKVKEPIAGDLARLRKDHLLFCYLHLAAEPALTRSLLDIGLTGVAFESVEESDGSLPLLAPMSIIAGRIAVQVGTHLLHQPSGGKGKLLGGLPSTERGKVVVLGAGAAGGNSAMLAAAGGANVVVFDKRQDRLAQMMAVRGIRGPRTAHGRSRRGCRAGAERTCSARGYRSHGQGHGTRQRAGRHLHRPGWLLRDVQANHLERSDLRGRWRHPLCRHQHAGCGSADVFAGNFRGDPSLRATLGQWSGMARLRSAQGWNQRGCRQDRARRTGRRHLKTIACAKELR